jgi:hypothetical protein
MRMKRRWVLTKAELDATSDDDLVQRVIDSVLGFVGDLAPGEDDYELVRQTPKSAQFFWAMRLLESEVINGGFEQYFWNSSCTLIDVAIDGYGAIGADGYAEFVQKALDIIGSGSSATRRQEFNNDWRAYKKACPAALNLLDDEFYASKGGDPDSGGQDITLQEQKVRYIRENLKLICEA